MSGGDAALKQAWKLIEIETSAKRSKRRGIRVSTFADTSDCMAAPAEFREQRSAVKSRILRLRSGTGRSQPGEQQEDYRQSFHCDIFVKREWRASQNKLRTLMLLKSRSNLKRGVRRFGLARVEAVLEISAVQTLLRNVHESCTQRKREAPLRE